MAKHTVVTMPGDGIGNQVLTRIIARPESRRLRRRVHPRRHRLGCWCDKGNALPDRTIELLTKHKLGLFGAITSKPNKAAQAELKPELRGKGYVYYSPIVTMRQKFNLDICMRPCIGFTGNPLNYIRKRTDGGFDEPQIDTTVFRQGTEGMYAGVEWTNPPENVRAALQHHPRFKAFAQRARPGPRGQLRIITRAAARAHRHRGLRIRQEARLQRRDHLRKAQRGPRNLRHDGRNRQGSGQGISRHRALVHQHRRAD